MNRILLSNFNTIRLLSCGKVVSPVVSVRQSVILSTGAGLSSSLRLCPLWGPILPHPGQRTLLYTEYPLPRHVQFCSLWSTYMLAGERFVSYWIAFSLIDKSTLILIFQWAQKDVIQIIRICRHFLALNSLDLENVRKWTNDPDKISNNRKSLKSKHSVLQMKFIHT